MYLFESEDFSLHQEDLGTWFNDGPNSENQLNHIVLDKDRPASVSTDAFQGIKRLTLSHLHTMS